MILFYNSELTWREMTTALKHALAIDPQSIVDPHRSATTAAARQVKDRVTGTFAVGRFTTAIIFLALLFAAGVYTAGKPELKEWSTVLLHTFEVALGVVVGIVIGEKTGKI